MKVQFEFYKMDFDSWDEGTDQLSLEQEGAYLRVCNHLYRRKAPIPSSPIMLARMWRCHPNKARRILADLVAAGKLCEQDGHLTNARVTRELDERGVLKTQKVDAGHIGGTRTQENRRKALETKDGDAADAWQPDKRNQAEEEEEREKTQIEPSSLSASPMHDGFPPHAFEQWWLAYPHKVGKDAARKSFERVRKSRRVSYSKLVAAVHAYKASKPDRHDYCNPSTWLNQGRWQDQPAPPAPLISSQASSFGQRLSGAAHYLHEKAQRRSGASDAPSLNLDPIPFPTRERDARSDAPSGTTADCRDDRWSDREGSGTLHDFPARRTIG